jgi:hypothetical protein
MSENMRAFYLTNFMESMSKASKRPNMNVRRSLHAPSGIDKRVIYLKLSEGGVKSTVPVG